MKTEDTLRIIEKHKGERGELISILQEIQAGCGYLPESALRVVASVNSCSLIDIYGIATFYKSFSLKPRGKHILSVCLGTACHVRGAPIIAGEFERKLRIKVCETTSDNEFTLETINCLGACALGPIVVVDGHYFSNVNSAKAGKILKKARVGIDRVEVKKDQRIFPVEVSCPQCNHSLMDPQHLVDGYPSIKVTVSFARKHGWLLLSCLYGSYAIKSEYDVPIDTVVNFFCPHCHAELISALNCSVCGAPMIPTIVRGGGILQICSRRGCKEHILDLEVVSF